MKRIIVLAIALLLTAFALLHGTRNVISHVEPTAASVTYQADDLPAAETAATENLRLSENGKYFVWKGNTIALVGNSSSYLPHVERARPDDWGTDGKNGRYDPVFENCTYDLVGGNLPDGTPKRKFHVCVEELKKAGLNHMKIWVALNHSVGRLRKEGPNPVLNHVGDPYNFEQPFKWLGGKWDLKLAYDNRDQPLLGFEDEFFIRLKDVVNYCETQDIIVGVEIFDPWSAWVDDEPKLSPWWAANNNLGENGVGMGFTDSTFFGKADNFDRNRAGVHTQPIDDNEEKNQLMRKIQIALLKRTVLALKDQKNFYWVLSNEPDFGATASGQPLITWLRYMAKSLQAAEDAANTNRHLIAVNVTTDPPASVGTHPTRMTTQP